MKPSVPNLCHPHLLKQLSFLIMCFLMIQCKAQESPDHLNYNKRTYALDFSNDDVGKIGMRKFDDGSEQSITSICQFGSFIFLTDPVHANVKRLSTTDGLLKASHPIANIGDISDVEVVDSLLHVVSTSGFLIVLDLELQPSKTIKLPLDVCSDIRFLKIGNDLHIFCPGDIDQDKITREITISALKIHRDLSFTHVSVSAGRGYNAYADLVQGYNVLKADSCLKVGGLTRCIDRRYPTGQRFPTTRTVSVTATSLAMFDVEDDQILIYEYDWP